MRSIDDNAYLRPGTSEGFNSVRNGRILTPAASEKMRKLPKYDWPIKKVYQTPLTHRVLMLESSIYSSRSGIMTVGLYCFRVGFYCSKYCSEGRIDCTLCQQFHFVQKNIV